MIVEQFAIHDGEPGQVVVFAFGEIDLGCRDAFTDALIRAVDRARCTVIVDMTSVTFMDSSGLHGLINGFNYAGGKRRSLMLRPSAPVRRVLELGGLSETFDLTD